MFSKPANLLFFFSYHQQQLGLNILIHGIDDDDDDDD